MTMTIVEDSEAENVRLETTMEEEAPKEDVSMEVSEATFRVGWQEGLWGDLRVQMKGSDPWSLLLSGRGGGNGYNTRFGGQQQWSNGASAYQQQGRPQSLLTAPGAAGGSRPW